MDNLTSFRDIDRPWYAHEIEGDEHAEEAAKILHGTVSRIEMEQQGRTTDIFKLMSIYLNRDLTRTSPFRSGLLRSMPMAIVNISQAIIDTLVAKQLVNESKATFDVDDGDFEATQRAEQLDKFCFGEVYRMRLYEKAELAFRDAGIVGDGWIKFYQRNGKVFCERVQPVEMRIDLAQCFSGPPRELYQIRYIARSQAMAYYNEFADEIEKMPVVDVPYPYPGTTRDIVRLVEAWHLPDDDSGEGGRYMFACGDIPLSFKAYTRQDFPFVRYSWMPDLMGGYSIGLMEQLVPMHSELQKLKKRHLQGLYIHGLPRVFQAAGSKLSPEDMTNSTIQKWTYSGTKPEVMQSPCVAPELVEEIRDLISQMWQLAGVSPLQSGADMPSRMDSRPGLREYAALADERHAMPSKSWDRGTLDAARNIIAIAREIVEEHGSYSTMGAAKDFVSRIDFKDVDLDDERFRTKLQNTNMLPTTPAGKRLAVNDLAQAGAFQSNPHMLWLMLSGSPDIDELISDETAGEKLVKKQIYMMVKKRTYFAPDKYQDCQYAVKYAANAIQRMLTQTNGGMKADGTRDGHVDEIYTLLDRYIVDCQDIITTAQGAANATGQPAGQPATGPQPQPAAGPAAGPLGG